MRFSIILAGVFAAGGASAHVGHLGELAAHDHWVGAGAIGIAIAVAGWQALKGGKGKAEEAEEEVAETDDAPQEA